jgi:dienelactone hydrolase
MTKIQFTSNGYKLAGNLFRAAEPRHPAFLFIQGWTGHQNVLAAQRLAGLGFTSMTYDMRGNGESEGNLADFSRADFVSDAINAYDYLKQQVGEGMEIGAVGSSFGSYTAVLLSARRDVYCLSLRVPANYPDAGFEEPQVPQLESGASRIFRSKKSGYNENKALRALHDFKGNVQIIEAGADEIVARQSPQNYANAVSGKAKLSYSVMEGAPHRLASDILQTEYEHLLTDWVKQFIISE